MHGDSSVQTLVPGLLRLMESGEEGSMSVHISEGGGAAEVSK